MIFTPYAYQEYARDTWSSEKDKWNQLNYLKILKVLGKQKDRLATLKESADIILKSFYYCICCCLFIN